MLFRKRPPYDETVGNQIIGLSDDGSITKTTIGLDRGQYEDTYSPAKLVFNFIKQRNHPSNGQEVTERSKMPDIDQISAATGLYKRTVAKTLKKLIKDGAVVEAKDADGNLKYDTIEKNLKHSFKDTLEELLLIGSIILPDNFFSRIPSQKTTKEPEEIDLARFELGYDEAKNEYVSNATKRALSSWNKLTEEDRNKLIVYDIELAAYLTATQASIDGKEANAVYLLLPKQLARLSNQEIDARFAPFLNPEILNEKPTSEVQEPRIIGFGRKVAEFLKVLAHKFELESTSYGEGDGRKTGPVR